MYPLMSRLGFFVLKEKKCMIFFFISLFFREIIFYPLMFQLGLSLIEKLHTEHKKLINTWDVNN